jgi:hypothetical protein
MVDPTFMADPSDATFNQACTAMLRCTVASHCYQGTGDLEQCYCGDQKLTDCLTLPGAARGPCKSEIETAARTTNPMDVGQRVTDLKYPAGWAFFLLQCDNTMCASECAR